MPWQNKRQTRGLIAEAVNNLRDETIEKLREISGNLQGISTLVDDLTTSLNTVQESIRTLRLYSENETKKLAAVVVDELGRRAWEEVYTCAKGCQFTRCAVLCEGDASGKSKLAREGRGRCGGSLAQGGWGSKLVASWD